MCRGCGSALTAPLVFGKPNRGGDDAAPTVSRGQYFVDPSPASKTYDGRTGELIAVGTTNCVVVNPYDVAGGRPHPDRLSGCCGPDGESGNTLCASCGAEVGALYADCWTSFEVRLDPDRVRGAGDDRTSLSDSSDVRADWLAAVGSRDLDDEAAADDEDDEYDDDGNDGWGESSFGTWHLCAGAGKVWVPATNGPLVLVVDAASATIQSVVELPNANVGVRSGRVPRWSIPTTAFGAGSVWVTDVIEKGLFAIDPYSFAVRGKVDVVSTDDRTPGAGASSEVAADGATVVATGRAQGDVVVIDPEVMSPARAVRVGRSLEGLAVDGDAVWVGDASDDTVRRVSVDSGEVVATLGLSGDIPGIHASVQAIRAGTGAIWVLAWENRTPGGVLYRIDHSTSEITATQRFQASPTTVCPTPEAVWVLGDLSYPAPSDDPYLARAERDEDDDEWENRTPLTRLDPQTLTPTGTTVLEGQVHDLVADDRWLWAVAFSARDQADRILRIDPSTGLEDARIGLGDISMGAYNPGPEPPEKLEPTAFMARVQAQCVALLEGATSSGVLRDLWVENVRLEHSDILFLLKSSEPPIRKLGWKYQLEDSGLDDWLDDPDRLAAILVATLSSLCAWRSEDDIDVRADRYWLESVN